MSGGKLVMRVVGLAAAFFVLVLAIDIAIGAVTGSPVNLPERARFWAILAPFWAVAQEWFRSKQQTVRREEANGA